jgi:hypothetical protein
MKKQRRLPDGAVFGAGGLSLGLPHDQTERRFEQAVRELTTQPAPDRVVRILYSVLASIQESIHGAADSS